MQHVAVIGNGVAGLTAGDTVRRLGFDGKIIVVGQEDHATYSRPALSKSALDPSRDLEVSYLPEATHRGVERLGCTAVALDPVSNRVTLDDGAYLEYDGLIIATGTSARRFTDCKREYVVRSVEDAVALRKRLQSQPSVVVVGGGPLGMELASGAIAMGCEVTLVHRGLPMEHHIGPLFAEIFADVASERGLRFVDDYVTSLHETPEGMSVHLTSEPALTADLVVSAVGDAPNVQWLATSGLLSDGRLVTDQYCRVRENIVAAGDVAWSVSPAGLQRNPVWTNAIEQAKTAATALVAPGAAEPLNFQSYFWTDQWDMNLKISGAVPNTEEEPIVAKGDLGQRSAVLHWPQLGSAAALNIRMPIPRLHRLARTSTVTV